MTNEELLARYAETRSPELRNLLAEQNLPLAGTVARRFSGRGVDYEDLMQIASLAMLNALERYRPEHGTKLSTFLLPSMIGEVRHYFRDRAGHIRMPRTVKNDLAKLNAAEAELAAELGREPSFEEVAEKAGIELSRALTALEARNALQTVSINGQLSNEDEAELEAVLGAEEKGYEVFEWSEFLSSAFEELEEREKQLLEYRYRAGLNQRETAEKLNVSQMTVSRTEKRILDKLRKLAGITQAAEEEK